MLAACAPMPGARRNPIVRPSPRRSIAAPLLAAHNRERAAVGSPPLAWDPALAAAAAGLCQPNWPARAAFAIRTRTQRPGQGENLWIGTRGAYPVEAMVGAWISERRLFRPGRFPDVSRTGRWSDVGHYTAIIWPATSHVGCGIGRSARWDVLVCRYAPAGNVDGVAVGRMGQEQARDPAGGGRRRGRW